MYQIVEGDTPDLIISFYDESGVLTAPASATWMCYDRDTGTLAGMPAPLPLTPIADQFTLTLPVTVTGIVNSANKFETRKIVVAATFAGSRMKSETFWFQIENLGES